MASLSGWDLRASSQPDYVDRTRRPDAKLTQTTPLQHEGGFQTGGYHVRRFCTRPTGWTSTSPPPSAVSSKQRVHREPLLSSHQGPAPGKHKCWDRDHCPSKEHEPAHPVRHPEPRGVTLGIGSSSIRLDLGQEWFSTSPPATASAPTEYPPRGHQVGRLPLLSSRQHGHGAGCLMPHVQRHGSIRLRKEHHVIVVASSMPRGSRASCWSRWTLLPPANGLPSSTA